MLQLGHITSVSNQQLSPQTLFPHTLFQEEVAAVAIAHVKAIE